MFYFKKALFLVVFAVFSLARAGSYDDFFNALARDDAGPIPALLARGFDPNSVGPDGQAALLLSFRNPSAKVAEILISHPATQVEVRNRQDESPLMLAAIKGHLQICEALIARDADVNKTGWTPLHYAATGGHVPVIQLLLKHHAYIDAESPNGTTPLMMAAMYGSPEAVKHLIEAGADFRLKNAKGMTALDFATQANRPDAISLINTALRTR